MADNILRVKKQFNILSNIILQKKCNLMPLSYGLNTKYFPRSVRFSAGGDI